MDTVARGPVPRDRFRLRVGFPRDRCMARDRPSPYGKGAVLDTVARGPVPRDRFRLQSARALGGFHARRRVGFLRDRCMARDRPSPYGD